MLSKDEKKELIKIESKPYMKPSLKRFKEFVGEGDKLGLLKSFNYIYKFITESSGEVRKGLEERKLKGEIKDIQQATKSIAGNVFSSMVIYIFLKNKEAGNIDSNIFITSKQSAIKKFGQDLTIYVGDETQKPDCDIVIYNSVNNKIILLSLKTSLRERAGQTYKWKLLLEIANSNNNDIKDKYDIKYNGTMPIVCFATVNFYNEINNPQQRGMFKFFDCAFIAKPGINADFIDNMSKLPDFIKRTIS